MVGQFYRTLIIQSVTYTLQLVVERAHASYVFFKFVERLNGGIGWGRKNGGGQLSATWGESYANLLQ